MPLLPRLEQSGVIIDLDYAQAAPYALLMILLSIPMAGILFRASQTPVSRV